MTRPSDSQPSSPELLERGRLTLQAIQYHERAARFQAAAASLKAAMVQAENGNTKELHDWLESGSHQFTNEMNLVSQADLDRRISEAEIPMRSIRIDQPIRMDQLGRVDQPVLIDQLGSVDQLIGSAEPNVADPTNDATVSLDSRNSCEFSYDATNSDETVHVKAATSQAVDAPIGTSNTHWARMERAAIKRLGASPVQSLGAKELFKAILIDNDSNESIELDRRAHV